MNTNEDGAAGGDQEYEQKRDPDAEEDEEMALKEKDLADDAPWKRIQKNTFTRWCNEHLKCVNKHIADLDTDLSDGIRLIALLQVLSQKRVSKHNQKPTFRSQKLENVSVAMKFIEDQNIKIVNIDSTDVVDGKRKLILGLIWLLILHYSISMPMWDDEGEFEEDTTRKRPPTPKEKLLSWIQNKVPELPIKNFTRDWNDGRAIGALVDAVAPGLCPDWEDWDPKDNLKNAKEAMKLAQDWLDVPQVLDPKDMCNPKVDDLSMMTYLAEFPKCKVKPGAPLRPKSNAKKVRAYGPGLEKGNVISVPTNFTVETFSAGSGKVEITIQGPDGKTVPNECKFNSDKNKTYTVTYTAMIAGTHTITVLFKGQQIQKSPYTVEIGDMKGNASKCSAKGPGLEATGLIVNKPTYFEVFTAGAGAGTPDVTVIDPNGVTTTSSVKVTNKGKNTFYVEYLPTVVGNYTIEIKFAGQHIPKSPYTVRISYPFNAQKAFAYGRGIQNKGLRVREECVFYINTKEAGEAALKVRMVGPGGIDEPCTIKDNGDGIYTCSYRPFKQGRYIINAMYGKKEISKAPFTVNIAPEATGPVALVRAFGPGLEGGVVGKSCDFTVETNGSVGALGFSIEGPSEAKINCKDNGDGSCEVSYFPTMVGEYAIHITCDEEDIVNSPYIAQIIPDKGGFDASKVKAYGPGLAKDGLELNKRTEFTIDAKAPGCGQAPVGVLIADQQGNPVKPDIKDNKNGTFTVSYTPVKPLKHNVAVTWGGVSIPESPFKINIGGGLGKVKVYGPGVEPNKVKSSKPTQFTVDCTEAGKAPVTCSVKSKPGVNGPKEKEIPCKVKDNGNNTFTVDYAPEAPGDYNVGVKFGGKEIPQSPIPVKVIPDVDFSKIKVKNLEPTVKLGKPFTLEVDTSEAGITKLAVSLKKPNGEIIEPEIEPISAKCTKVSFTPEEEGPHELTMSQADYDLGQIVIIINVVVKTDPSMCSASGPGLVGGHVNKPSEFMINVGGAGHGGLSVTVEGPSEAEIECNDNGDGTCAVFYTPMMIGTYAVNVLFANVHIPGSPFAAKVIDSTLVESWGPGLIKGYADLACPFEVDCQAAGKAPEKEGVLPVECSVVGPDGEVLDTSVKRDPRDDDLYILAYTPMEEGQHTLHVTYGGYSIPDFSRRVDIDKPIDLSGVTVRGRGFDNNDAVFCDCAAEFQVDAKPLGTPLDKDLLKTDVTAPSGKKVKPVMKDNKDNTFDVNYTPIEKGEHTVDVSFAGQPLGDSPYTVGAIPGHDASRCKAYGPGLESAVTNKPAVFTVETKGAGKGGLGLAIEGPSEAAMECVDNKDGSCTVTYLPTVPGDYEVHITFADDPIPGSPFRPTVCDSIDASKVKASGPGLDNKGVKANAPATFKVDASKAGGKAPLDVTIMPERAPIEKAKVVDNKDGTYDVTYVPKAEGKLQVDIEYGGRQIPQSPVFTKVLPNKADASKVKVKGPGVEKGVLASLPVEFTVDTRDAGDADLEITITDGSGKPIIPEVIDNQDGTFKIIYTPKDVDRYTIKVKYGGVQVPKSPWVISTSPTGDASKCDIIGCKSGNYEIPVRRRSLSSESTTTTRTTTTRTTTTKTITKTVTVEEETVFKVNSRDAGKGHVTCTIVGPDGKEVPDCSVVDNGDGTFDIIWTCPAPGTYNVDIKFGGVSLTGGPITISGAEGPPEDLIDSEQIMPQECRPLELQLPVLGAGHGNINGEVKRPSGKKDIPTITENKSGTITVKYAPQETGKHELSIKYGSSHVPGSPFEFHVDELKSGQATAFGPGLTHGICGETATFTVNTKDAGPGGLALAVEGPSKAEIKCVDNKDGTCNVTYFPQKIGQYEVTVKFADKHVPGSPFKANVVDKAGSMMSIGAASDVPLKITETDITQLKASITPPSGGEEPCTLKRLPNGNIGITFTPKEVGEHLVTVKKFNRQIPGSPFKIIVGSQEVGDSSKVKVRGRGISDADAGQMAEFVVDTRDAGYGGLGVSIEGPSKTEINCSDLGDGTCAVTYRPAEPGTYKLNVRFAEQDIPGSPFNVKVHPEDGSCMEPLMQATLDKPTRAAPVSHIGSECELGLKIPDTDPLDMTAQVTNPKGKTEDAEIVDGADCRYVVRFVPTMDGVHTVSVKSRGLHVPGSPFQFTVGPFGEGGAHKVHAGGPGLERGEINVPAEFTVWTREAGPGKLSISVKGPAKAKIDIQDNKDGSYQVIYTPTAPGEYVIDIMYNDQPIPDSPFKAMVTPAIGEARRLSVSSIHESGLKANQPCSFAVQLNGAKGDLKAKAVAPSGVEDECTITEIDNENYAVRFLPRENGVHLIHVFFKDAPIPGSPFRVRVGGPDVIGDPGMVHAYGDGLDKGRTGEPAEFIVNTCGAGAGSLSITIDAPSKVKLDVQEIGEGYKCIYYPTQPGDHLISIKYAGAHHIGGSPFKAKIIGKGKGPVSHKVEQANVTVETTIKTTQTSSMPCFSSDASKCTASGAGLKKAFLSKKSQFTVNCSEGGQNMLLVGIAGPKTPCEEIIIKHMGRQRFTISYILKETGNYKMIVKWGEDHIPGSPFMLHCS